MTKGILVAAMHMANAAPDEFNDWYDTEHMPDRRKCPGFLTAMRWIATSDPHLSIAIYDLESISVLRSPSYLGLRGENLSPWSRRLGRKYKGVLRFEGHQIEPGNELAVEFGDGIVLIVDNYSTGIDNEPTLVPAPERVSNLLSVPGVISVRRFSAESDNRRHLTICQLTSPAIVDTHAWKQAMDDGKDQNVTREIALTATLYRRQT